MEFTLPSEFATAQHGRCAVSGIEFHLQRFPARWLSTPSRQASTASLCALPDQAALEFLQPTKTCEKQPMEWITLFPMQTISLFTLVMFWLMWRATAVYFPSYARRRAALAKPPGGLGGWVVTFFRLRRPSAPAGFLNAPILITQTIAASTVIGW
jgi:hypothetical protein